MRGIEIGVFALQPERRLYFVKSWKLWMSFSDDGGWTKIWENGSEGLVIKATSLIVITIISRTGALELS